MVSSYAAGFFYLLDARDASIAHMIKDSG